MNEEKLQNIKKFDKSHEDNIKNKINLKQETTIINFNEIQEIFNKDFYSIVENLKEIFVLNQKYDYYWMSDSIEKYLRSLNFKKEYNKIKIFFDEVYSCLPNDKLKLKNIILNEYEISAQKIILKSYPRKIELALTNKCNFRCIMCDEISHSGDYSASDRIVNDLMELLPYLQCLIIRGGEVFLDSRFDEILEQCRKNDVNVDIITNGSLLNNKNMNKLLDNDKIVITLSIDSLKKTVYEYIRKNSSFDKLLDIIKLLNEIRKQKRSKTTIGINMVVMSINYMEIEDMINFAGVNNFRFINLIPVLHNPQYNLNADIIKKINYNNQKYLDIAKKYNIDVFNRIPSNKDEVSINEIVKETSDDYNKNDEKEKISNMNNMENEFFCIKPFYYMLIDKNIIKPTCHCNILEQETTTNKNFNNNTILASWNGITFCNYREAMFSNDKYKFCSDECIKNNLLFNCDDDPNK